MLLNDAATAEKSESGHSIIFNLPRKNAKQRKQRRSNIAFYELVIHPMDRCLASIRLLGKLLRCRYISAIPLFPFPLSLFPSFPSPFFLLASRDLRRLDPKAESKWPVEALRFTFFDGAWNKAKYTLYVYALLIKQRAITLSDFHQFSCPTTARVKAFRRLPSFRR